MPCLRSIFQANKGKKKLWALSLRVNIKNISGKMYSKCKMKKDLVPDI